MDETIKTLIELAGSAATGFGAAWIKMAKYQQKTDRLIEDVRHLTASTDAVRMKVERILEWKVRAQKDLDDRQLVDRRSPLKLTPRGEKLIKDSGFEDIFSQIKNDLVLELWKMNPLTKYDVQEKARLMLDGMVDAPEFIRIKGYAYDHGEDASQILRAGAILLRDEYLVQHPEITK
jgi:hypothetical protein